jgi:hypothetical protein
MTGKSIEQRGMEEAAESGEETSHSAHGNGVSDCKVPAGYHLQYSVCGRLWNSVTCSQEFVITIKMMCKHFYTWVEHCE